MKQRRVIGGVKLLDVYRRNACEFLRCVVGLYHNNPQTHSFVVPGAQFTVLHAEFEWIAVIEKFSLVQLLMTHARSIRAHAPNTFYPAAGRR
jgi:hypothetical protein